MPLETNFLPADRLSHAEILVQASEACDSSVLMAMLDTAPGMVALLNPERQIVLCNDACAKAGGLASKEDALGMRPGELLRCVHATDMPGGCGTAEACRCCVLAQSAVAGQQGSAKSGECLLQCHGPDQDIPAEYAVVVTPVPRMGSGWQCYSLRDISDAKRRESLERIFFHDIMNRAGAVEGISSVLAGDELALEERGSFVEMLAVSARALVEEIRSQHALLSAETGTLAAERKTCDSANALREAIASCKAFGFTGDRQVVILPGAQSIVFQTDATLLGRVLVNLLKNAIEATGTGRTVTATCTMPTADLIRFSVHNEAVMPVNTREHVFQRSFTTKGSGRGLGTYSIKLLTERYLGGRVYFDSTAGKGTTFHVEFAAARTVPEQVSQPPAVSASLAAR